MRPVQAADIARISDPSLRSYAQRFLDTARKLESTMERYGLALETPDEAVARRQRVRALRASLVSDGAEVFNDGKSIAIGPRSPACARCRTGVRSVSSFVSLACGRDCWFCFNPNQHDWDAYRTTHKDWRSELEGWKATLGSLDYVALTGGEPLLFPREAVAFVEEATRLTGHGHVRMYTSGTGLDTALIGQLAEAGLSEIRFSVKLDEPAEAQAAVLDAMRQCIDRIPCVMVEMPVQPGTRARMEELLRELDEIGIFGVNLLELCFPLHNADAFRKRGLTLVRDPYQVPYSYGYAGALPIAGSEELALRLMSDAVARGTRLALHYCSLENKNTAQIYAQNHGGALDIPPYRFSDRSFFYETVRAFGDDAVRVEALLAQGRHPFETAGDGAARMVAFDPAALRELHDAGLRDVQLFLASAVFETGDAGKRFREVGLHVLEPHDLAGLPS